MSTRSSMPKKSKSAAAVIPPPQRKVLVAPSGVDVGALKVLTLPHPKSGAPAKFATSQDLSRFYELLQFNEPFRSWFIDDFVESDGRMIMVPRVNPLFLVLPLLVENASDVYRSLDDILTTKEFPDLSKLCSSDALAEALHLVATVKEVSGEEVLKYSEKKTADWLDSKLTVLCDLLIKDPQISPLIKNDEQSLRRYAFGFLCDYLPAALHKSMKTHFGIADATPKEDGLSHGSPSKGKKRKLDEINTPAEDYFREDLAAAKSTEVKLTPVQRKLKQASAGTKSLTSFFSKK